MTVSPRRLFLIDGLGALVSALLFIFVLARLQDVFGMPQQIVYALSIIAMLYSIFSLGCYCLVRKNERAFLNLIVTANLLYCLVILVLISYFFDVLTWIGVAYFTGEVVIIGVLAFVEIRIARRAV